VRDAPTHLVAEAIRTGGLANMKAVRIQDSLITLTEEQQKQGGTKSLSDYLYDKLTQYTSEEGWQYLRRIPGVGPKTAACVLMFNMNRPLMPVDTQVEQSKHYLLFHQSEMQAIHGLWIVLT
jgi:endonuclease-3